MNDRNLQKARIPAGRFAPISGASERHLEQRAALHRHNYRPQPDCIITADIKRNVVRSNIPNQAKADIFAPMRKMF